MIRASKQIGVMFALFQLALQIVTGEVQERKPYAEESQTSRPTLEQVHSLLKRRLSGESINSVGPIGLGGFNFARTFDLGSGVSLVAISCNLGGGMIAFDADGHLVASRRTWELGTLQVVDLDGDGRDEVITTEKDGVGTGLITWAYHIYRLAPAGWQHLWSGVSWSSISSEAGANTREGFLRVADLGKAQPRIVFVERAGDSGPWQTSAWVLNGGQFQRAR